MATPVAKGTVSVKTSNKRTKKDPKPVETSERDKMSTDGECDLCGDCGKAVLDSH